MKITPGDKATAKPIFNNERNKDAIERLIYSSLVSHVPNGTIETTQDFDRLISGMERLLQDDKDSPNEDLNPHI